MARKLLFLLLSSFLTMASPKLFAQDLECAEDRQKFCASVKPGDGKIADCLKEHKNQLSPACKAKMEEVKEDIKEACNADREKYCKGVLPGGGRIKDCLKAHESKLSPECKIGLMAKEKGKD